MIIGKNMTLREDDRGSRSMLEDLIRVVAEGGVAPVIDRVFSFEEAAKAYAYLKYRQHLGKVMIRR